MGLKVENSAEAWWLLGLIHHAQARGNVEACRAHAAYWKADGHVIKAMNTMLKQDLPFNEVLIPQLMTMRIKGSSNG